MKKSLLGLMFVVSSLCANSDDALNGYENASEQNPLSEKVGTTVGFVRKTFNDWLKELQQQPSVQHVTPSKPTLPADQGALIDGQKVSGQNSSGAINNQSAQLGSKDASGLTTALQKAGSDAYITMKTKWGQFTTQVKTLISPDTMAKLKTYVHKHDKEILVGVAAVVLIGGTVYVVYETGAMQKLSTWVRQHPKAVATLVVAAAVVGGATCAYTYNVNDIQSKMAAFVALVTKKLQETKKAA